MKIKVLLFARLRDLAGVESVELEVAPGSTVGQLWHQLQTSHPSLATFSPPPLAAVNQEYAGPETSLFPAAEVAFLPPVSGG